MLTLIKNAKVYREGGWRQSDILLTGGVIDSIDDIIPCPTSNTAVIDAEGRHAIPGYIDQHVHITGGGGEGGFLTQVPPMRPDAPVKAGVTTVVGLLGTDGATRSIKNLVAKTKALKEFGLTAYCLTGNYNYPSPTLTGSVLDDITFIEEIIGVKIAISDHRGPNMSKEELIKLASDARVAGLLAGKAGIVHLHTGKGKSNLDMLFEIIKETDIPVTVFRPTHLAHCLDDAVRFAKEGGYIDFTCSAGNPAKRAGTIIKAMEQAPEHLVTISTDSNGSMPKWNDKKEMIGIGAGKIDSMPENVAAMVTAHGFPLERAILPATKNIAGALRLYPKKGVLAPGSDADITLLGDDLLPDTVFAGGKLMMKNKEMQVHAYFEDI